MNEYKIDKKIPIPGPGGGRNDPKYPLGKMNVGDSFLAKTSREKIYPAVSYYAKRHPPAKFTVRKIAENEYRVWRIK